MFVMLFLLCYVIFTLKSIKRDTNKLLNQQEKSIRDKVPDQQEVSIRDKVPDIPESTGIRGVVLLNP